METLFLTILRMSLSASAVILVVLLIRVLLRHAPKKWSYLLWSVVGFRLCCPVSFRSAFSLFAVAPTQTQRVEHLLSETPMVAAPTIAPSTVTLPTAAPQITATPQISTVHLWPTLGIILWCVGMAALLIYSFVRILRLRSLLLDAVQLEPGVWQSDRIATPFVMGLIHPKIYIPTETDSETLRYVLTHERIHLKRGDHWIKALAFLLLMVHWFNPLCWLAFVLMNRDMELSCDERVLAEHGPIARSYSLSLLHFATARRFPAPEMLAFGESDVKRRVKNALKWKKPKRWVTVLAAFLCVVAVAACASNPRTETSGSSGETESESAANPKTEATGLLGEAESESAAIQRMLTLQGDDILFFASRMTPEDSAYYETFAAALRNAAAHGAAEKDEAYSAMTWYYADFYLSALPGGGFGTGCESFHFEENLTEPVIHIYYENPKANVSERIRLEDETLYWLIRNNYTLSERVETAALAPYKDIIHRRAADTSERIDGLTGYDLISFYSVDRLSDSVHQYDVYVWYAAYHTDDPNALFWAGGMGLDSQGRVIGLNEEDCYFVVRDDGVYRFMGFDLPFGYDDADIRSHNLNRIQQTFAQDPGA